MIRHIFDTIGSGVLLAVFSILFVAEIVLQLRKRTQPKLKRFIINFVLSLPAFALLRLLLIPAMVWLAGMNATWDTGLNHLYAAPGWVKAMLAFLLLDYSNYL